MSSKSKIQNFNDENKPNKRVLTQLNESNLMLDKIALSTQILSQLRLIKKNNNNYSHHPDNNANYNNSGGTSNRQLNNLLSLGENKTINKLDLLLSKVKKHEDNVSIDNMLLVFGDGKNTDRLSTSSYSKDNQRRRPNSQSRNILNTTGNFNDFWNDSYINTIGSTCKNNNNNDSILNNNKRQDKIKSYQKTAAKLLIDRIISIIKKHFLVINQYANHKYTEKLKQQRHQLDGETRINKLNNSNPGSLLNDKSNNNTNQIESKINNSYLQENLNQINTISSEKLDLKQGLASKKKNEYSNNINQGIKSSKSNNESSMLTLDQLLKKSSSENLQLDLESKNNRQFEKEKPKMDFNIPNFFKEKLPPQSFISPKANIDKKIGIFPLAQNEREVRETTTNSKQIGIFPLPLSKRDARETTASKKKEIMDLFKPKEETKSKTLNITPKEETNDFRENPNKIQKLSLNSIFPSLQTITSLDTPSGKNQNIDPEKKLSTFRSNNIEGSIPLEVDFKKESSNNNNMVSAAQTTMNTINSKLGNLDKVSKVNTEERLNSLSENLKRISRRVKSTSYNNTNIINDNGNNFTSRDIETQDQFEILKTQEKPLNSSILEKKERNPTKNNEQIISIGSKIPSEYSNGTTANRLNIPGSDFNIQPISSPQNINSETSSELSYSKPNAANSSQIDDIAMLNKVKLRNQSKNDSLKRRNQAKLLIDYIETFWKKIIKRVRKEIFQDLKNYKKHNIEKKSSDKIQSQNNLIDSKYENFSTHINSSRVRLEHDPEDNCKINNNTHKFKTSITEIKTQQNLKKDFIPSQLEIINPQNEQQTPPLNNNSQQSDIPIILSKDSNPHLNKKDCAIGPNNKNHELKPTLNPFNNVLNPSNAFNNVLNQPNVSNHVNENLYIPIQSLNNMNSENAPLIKENISTPASIYTDNNNNKDENFQFSNYTTDKLPSESKNPSEILPKIEEKQPHDIFGSSTTNPITCSSRSQIPEYPCNNNPINNNNVAQSNHDVIDKSPSGLKNSVEILPKINENQPQKIIGSSTTNPIIYSSSSQIPEYTYNNKPVDNNDFPQVINHENSKPPSESKNSVEILQKINKNQPQKILESSIINPITNSSSSQIPEYTRNNKPVNNNDFSQFNNHATSKPPSEGKKLSEILPKINENQPQKILGSPITNPIIYSSSPQIPEYTRNYNPVNNNDFSQVSNHETSKPASESKKLSEILPKINENQPQKIIGSSIANPITYSSSSQIPEYTHDYNSVNNNDFSQFSNDTTSKPPLEDKKPSEILPKINENQLQKILGSPITNPTTCSSSPQISEYTNNNKSGNNNAIAMIPQQHDSKSKFNDGQYDKSPNIIQKKDQELKLDDLNIPKQNQELICCSPFKNIEYKNYEIGNLTNQSTSNTIELKPEKGSKNETILPPTSPSYLMANDYYNHQNLDKNILSIPSTNKISSTKPDFYHFEPSETVFSPISCINGMQTLPNTSNNKTLKDFPINNLTPSYIDNKNGISHFHPQEGISNAMPEFSPIISREEKIGLETKDPSLITRPTTTITAAIIDNPKYLYESSNTDAKILSKLNNNNNNNNNTSNDSYKFNLPTIQKEFRLNFNNTNYSNNNNNEDKYFSLGNTPNIARLDTLNGEFIRNLRFYNIVGNILNRNIKNKICIGIQKIKEWNCKNINYKNMKKDKNALDLIIKSFDVSPISKTIFNSNTIIGNTATTATTTLTKNNNNNDAINLSSLNISPISLAASTIADIYHNKQQSLRIKHKHQSDFTHSPYKVKPKNDNNNNLGKKVDKMKNYINGLELYCKLENLFRKHHKRNISCAFKHIMYHVLQNKYQLNINKSNEISLRNIDNMTSKQNLNNTTTVTTTTAIVATIDNDKIRTPIRSRRHDMSMKNNNTMMHLNLIKLTQMYKYVKKSNIKYGFFQLRYKSKGLYVRDIERLSLLLNVISKKVIHNQLLVKNIFGKLRISTDEMPNLSPQCNTNLDSLSMLKDKSYLPKILISLSRSRQSIHKANAFMRIKYYIRYKDRIKLFIKLLSNILYKTLRRSYNVLIYYNNNANRISNDNTLSHNMFSPQQGMFSFLNNTNTSANNGHHYYNTIIRFVNLIQNILNDNLSQSFKLMELYNISKRNHQNAYINLALKLYIVIFNNHQRYKQSFLNKLENYSNNMIVYDDDNIQEKKHRLLFNILQRKYYLLLKNYLLKYQNQVSLIRLKQMLMNNRVDKMKTIIKKINDAHKRCKDQGFKAISLYSQDCNKKSTGIKNNFKGDYNKNLRYSKYLPILIKRINRAYLDNKRFAFQCLKNNPNAQSKNKKQLLGQLIQKKIQTNDQKLIQLSFMKWREIMINTNFMYKQAENKLMNNKIKKFFKDWRLAHTKNINEKSKIKSGITKLFLSLRKIQQPILKDIFDIIKIKTIKKIPLPSYPISSIDKTIVIEKDKQLNKTPKSIKYTSSPNSKKSSNNISRNNSISNVSSISQIKKKQSQ